MVITTVTELGNPILRKKAKLVTNSTTKHIKKIIEDLTDTMRHLELVGMAAPQIGKSVRVFVTEIRKTKLRKQVASRKIVKLRIFVNPEILEQSTLQVEDWEGCGSVASAQLFGLVKRSKTITVRAQDENGDLFTLTATDLLARIIQHEYDHLEGVIFTDKAKSSSFMSRSEYVKMRAHETKL